MTKKWSNLNLPGALHYVTGNVLHRVPIFAHDECCKAFLDVLAGVLKDWPRKLIAFVIMPDHFHLIANPRDGDVSGFTGAIKSLTAKRIIELTSDQRFLFIHALQRGIALKLSCQWTSFRAFYFNSGEPLSVDHEWWWPDDSEKLSKSIKELKRKSAGASHPS